jgi:hypothetical protein
MKAHFDGVGVSGWQQGVVLCSVPIRPLATNTLFRVGFEIEITLC